MKAVFLLFLTSLSCKANSIQWKDTIIHVQDLSLFDFLPIKTDKKNTIELRIDQNETKSIVMKKGNFKKAYNITNQEDYKLIVSIDTSTGAHRHKHMYDSIIIWKKFILYQRKYFTPKDVLLRSEVKVVNVTNDTCEFSRFYPENNQGIMQLFEDYKSNKLNLLTPPKKFFLLKKLNGNYYYNKQSLFWHMVDYFFDFSTK